MKQQIQFCTTQDGVRIALAKAGAGAHRWFEPRIGLPTWSWIGTAQFGDIGLKCLLMAERWFATILAAQVCPIAISMICPWNRGSATSKPSWMRQVFSASRL